MTLTKAYNGRVMVGRYVRDRSLLEKGGEKRVQKEGFLGAQEEQNLGIQEKSCTFANRIT